MSLTPQKCPAARIIIDGNTVLKSNMNGVKKNVSYLGKIKNLIYFQTK
jgi:hypothetical protein